MSDRLGVAACWAVYVVGPIGTSAALEHHFNASAEIGDSGGLIIRVERDDPKTEGEKNRYAVARAYSPAAWRAVITCLEDHSTSAPRPAPPVEVLQDTRPRQKPRP